MNAKKKEHELFLELSLLAERYSLDEIQELKIKSKNLTFDDKIIDLIDVIHNLKNTQTRMPIRKKPSSKSTNYELKVLKDLKKNNPNKYAILKPIADMLINDKNKVKFSNIKELILELGGDKKDFKSRRDAIRVLIKMFSMMTKEEIEKYSANLGSERKEGGLDELANLIMGESNAKG